MFDVLKKAGLSVDEFSVVVGISRTAVFNWKANRSRPHKQVAVRVDKAVAFLGGLADRSKLPLKEDLTREERAAKIAKLRELFQQYV